MKIAIIGTGNVGLVSGTCFAERALLLSGLRMLTAVAWAVSCIAAPAFAASSQVSVLPEGARRMTAGEIYDLYRDKSWQWDSGAGRMVGADRQFSAWTDGETGKSWAEGRWIITETGWMCLNATWHSEQGVFPRPAFRIASIMERSIRSASPVVSGMRSVTPRSTKTTRPAS